MKTLFRITFICMWSITFAQDKKKDTVQVYDYGARFYDAHIANYIAADTKQENENDFYLIKDSARVAPNCQIFRTGTFYYPQIPDYGYTIREKTIQRSYVKEKDMWVFWDVKWVDNCDFDLIFKEAKNDDGTFKTGDKIAVSITSIDADCYSFSCVFYNKENPQGKKMPSGKMCIKK